MARKISILNNKDELEKAISISSSIKETLTNLGLRAAGGNYKAIKIACINFGLELPVFDNTQIIPNTKKYIPDEKVFIENSTYNNRRNLKKRMFALGIPNVCSCGQGPMWNGKPLTLTLEHKNGVWNDNRLENLEILCGHCHSQTETFAGRNGHLRPDTIDLRVMKLVEGEYIEISPKSFCLDCDKEITKNYLRCGSCAGGNRFGIKYPEVEELISKITLQGYLKTSKEIGVSDTALRKHMKKYLSLEHPIFNKQKKRNS